MKLKIKLDIEELINAEEINFNELLEVLFDDDIWAAHRMSPSSAKKVQKALDCYNEE